MPRVNISKPCRKQTGFGRQVALVPEKMVKTIPVKHRPVAPPIHERKSTQPQKPQTPVQVRRKKTPQKQQKSQSTVTPKELKKNAVSAVSEAKSARALKREERIRQAEIRQQRRLKLQKKQIEENTGLKIKVI